MGCYDTNDYLDDEHPLWLVNEQIKGLLEGVGATEDHEDVLTFLRATGLPEGTVRRVHRAIVHGDSKAGAPELYVVVQYAGFTSEKVVHEARTFDDAFCAMCEIYEPGEREELHVDIMKRLENGDLTTEY